MDMLQAPLLKELRKRGLHTSIYRLKSFVMAALVYTAAITKRFTHYIKEDNP